MNDESKTEGLEARAGGSSRTGKIARLPRAVRDELNQRLRDGESGASLVNWLNELPQVKAALQRDFGGRAINEQNLSDWKQGGYRDWLAREEAAELLADAVGLGHETKGPSVSDRVAGWFFPHYVAAARGQLDAAQTPAERWSVLRTICGDLAHLRRSDHYVERLRIWQEKLRLETEVVTAQMAKRTEKDFREWARTQPDLEHKIWPDRESLTYEERQRRMRDIRTIDYEDDMEAG